MLIIIMINIVIIIEEGAGTEPLGAVTTCQMLCQALYAHYCLLSLWVGPSHPTLQMKKLRLRGNKDHQSHMISDWQSWILYLHSSHPLWQSWILYLHSSHPLSTLLVCDWTNGCVGVCVCLCVCVMV